MSDMTETEFDWVTKGCGDRCQDFGIHQHFTRPNAFRWCWPKIDTGITAADPRTRVVLNRYPHHIIGVAIYVRGHGIGLRWKR